MLCPKCEEGMLKKIQFKKNRKKAFLCDLCESFWWEDEHVTLQHAHALDRNAQIFAVPDTYDLLKKQDKEEQDEKDERELYGKF